MVEKNGNVGIVQYLLSNYKMDSNGQSNKSNEINRNLFTKIVNNNDNLDIQLYLKLIDNITLNDIQQVSKDDGDLNLKIVYLLVFALQSYKNEEKKGKFASFLSNNINSLKHEVLF